MTKLIDLSLAGLSVSLRLFSAEDFPRIKADSGGKLTYTASGSTVGFGQIYEPKHLWDIKAYVTHEQAQILKLIWAEHDYLRRSLSPCDITVIDKTQTFEERYPRTRAIAPGTTETLYPSASSPTHVLYFCVFAGWMPIAPKFTAAGNNYLVATFTLQETDKTHES